MWPLVFQKPPSVVGVGVCGQCEHVCECVQTGVWMVWGRPGPGGRVCLEYSGLGQWSGQLLSRPPSDLSAQAVPSREGAARSPSPGPSLDLPVAEGCLQERRLHRDRDDLRVSSMCVLPQPRVARPSVACLPAAKPWAREDLTSGPPTRQGPRRRGRYKRHHFSSFLSLSSANILTAGHLAGHPTPGALAGGAVGKWRAGCE